jgi:OmcA/MtrC family decaheme c-type cytochrome
VDASNQTVIKFRILQAVAPATTATPIILNGNSTNPLTGYTGAPGFLLAYNLSATNQPFTTSPDYNNAGVKAAQPKTVSIAALMPLKADGTANTTAVGTLSAPDASGYYTATITAAASNFPVGAQLRAVGLQGYFTQAAGTNGIAAATARHAIAVQKPVATDAVRRTVIDPAKCGNCHEWFEGHGGNRVYTVQVCVMCHVPNLSSSGKGANPATAATLLSAATQALMVAEGILNPLDPTTYPEESNNFKDMIHGIHAGSSRTSPLIFVRDRGSALMYFSAKDFVFPGILKECTMCHTSSGYTSIPAGAQVTTVVTSNGTALDLTNNVATVSAARTSLPNATDLVTTPFTAACVSCHDAVPTVAHMKLNGGQIKVLRSAADPAAETCVVCHGTTGTANIANAHKY